MKTTLAAIGLSAVAIAGCGTGGSGGTTQSPAAASASSTSPTLYTFSKDTTGRSNCSGPCAKNWPPATAAGGISGGKVTMIKRTDGTSQAALDGHPLYRFAGDRKAGDANGDRVNAFGGLWKTAGGSAASSPAPARSYGY
jgi:predicted lipoprotein with Yx(FWY)xxD motif